MIDKVNIECSSNYLTRQIDAIKPKVIVKNIIQTDYYYKFRRLNMRIDNIPNKDKFKKINILPESNPVEENLNGLSDVFKSSMNGVSLQGGNFQSSNFVKKKKGWMLEETGKIWIQELYAGNDDTYLSFDKTDGMKYKGNTIITNPGDIDGSTINNDINWTDDTIADIAQATALSKAKIFRQDTEPASGMTTGDIWIDTNDGDRPYSYNGTAWVETLTVIDGGKITTGTIDASVVTVNNIVAGNITSGTLLIARTEAKCTDANADQTSVNTAANTNQVQGYTLMSAGLIQTGRITCSNINAGTLTGRTVQTHSGSTTGSKLVAGAGLKIYGDYATFYSGSTAVGHIHADSTTNFQMYGYAGKTLELGAGSSASLNAGGGTCQLRYGNTAIININGTNYSGTVGISTNQFASMYARTYNLGRSGYTTYYIQRGTSGIECNTNFYVGGALSKASGTFKIDHPLKPKTHWLEHSFVESPDMLNVYTKNAKIKGGICKVTMPDWFIPLNGKKKSNYRYQLTSIGQENSLWVQQEMNNKGEVIFAGKKNGKFSYSIFGIRHDKWAREHRVKVETKKD